MPSKEYIYKKMDFSNDCYLLKKGFVEAEITPEDKFKIEKPGTIFGAGELIVEKELGRFEMRHFAVKNIDGCEITNIPKNNLKQVLHKKNIIFNVAMQLTQNILELQKIVGKMEAEAGKEEQQEKELAVLYSDTIGVLQEKYEQTKFPWLDEVMKKYSESLLFMKGKAFSRFSGGIAEKLLGKENVDLSNFDAYAPIQKSFSSADKIMSNGDKPNKLYILCSGKLQVMKDGKVLSYIDKPGTIIGELYFFMNVDVTVDLVCDEDAVLIELDKKGKDATLSEEEIKMFHRIICTLSHQELVSCNTIAELQKNGAEQAVSKERMDLKNKILEYKNELKTLGNELKAMSDKYELEWVEDLSNDFQKKFKEII